jgi:hypothetical protein
MATVVSASAVTMPGSELVTKLAASTSRPATPWWRSVTQATG